MSVNNPPDPDERASERSARAPGSDAVSFRASLPLAWELARPRRGRMLFGLLMLLVSRAAGLIVPYAPKVVLDKIIPNHETGLLRPLFALLALSVLLQAGTTYALSQLLSLEGQRLVTEMRRRVQAHIARLPVAFFDANKTGALISRVMNDVTGIRNLVGQGFVELLGSIVTAVLVFFILLHISVMLTLVTVAFLAVLLGFLTWSFLAIRPMFRQSAKLASEVSGRLVETFSGIRVVKAYRAEVREDKVFAEGAQRMLENANKTITLGSVMGAVGALDVRLLSSVVLCVGAGEVMAHQLTAGSLFSFILYLALVVAPITQMASVGTQLSEAFAGLDRTREVLREKVEDSDPERTVRLKSVKGLVEFQSVSFEYEPGKPVLHDVSFEAQPGTVTALVGSSGSGKSTITGLVGAFYKPTAGKILIDGADLNSVRLGTYRSALGIVPQESFLFDGTIRENVAFGAVDATEEQFRAACRIAHVDDFAQRYKHKYETVIGERGVRLSGGQRQRVSIARAILADPRILILDEATSSLDSVSEALIQKGLSYLMKGRTTFVIAHRLSTARHADQILVVEGGRIVERGTHESLYAQRGRYFELYSRQHDIESNIFAGSGDDAAAVPGTPPPAALIDRAGPDEGESQSLSELL
jgi:ABC-type multidrug transport system fused ATPase/permease subunit